MALLHAVLVAATARAAPAAPEAYWNSCLTSCFGLSDPDFQDQLKQFKRQVATGKAWERKVALEKAELQRLIDVTCPAYLAEPNGEKLVTFTAEFSRIASNAVNSQMQARTLRSYLGDRYGSAKKYLREFDVLFESSSCAKAMDSATLHLTEEEKNIENQFMVLKVKCPALADAAAAVAVRAAKEKAGALEANPKADAGAFQGGKSKNGNSTITGVKDLEGERK